jgi:hypothetical protein
MRDDVVCLKSLIHCIPGRADMLAAFKNLDHANHFASSYADEIEHELAADIEAEIEQHLLRMTGRRILAG